ncbi:helix-turn-helix domain-containing protein [Paenibacillus sp. Pae108]
MKKEHADLAADMGVSQAQVSRMLNKTPKSMHREVSGA